MISPLPSHVEELPEWTPRRRQLYGRLAERAAPLAGLYASGVFLLASPSWPGRHHLLGHSVREIVQRLPDFLDPQPQTREQQDEALRSFVDVWLEADLPMTAAGLVPITSELTEANPPMAVISTPSVRGEVAVPATVAQAAAMLVATYEQVSYNNYDKAASIILARPGVDPASLNDQVPASRDATVLQWTRTARWFLGFTHVSARPDKAMPGEDELRHKFEIVESTLEAILAPFYRVIYDLDQILGVANAPIEAGQAVTVSSGDDHQTDRVEGGAG